MSVEPVTLIPQCAECQQVWLADDRDRWRAYWIAADTDEQVAATVAEWELRHGLEPRDWLALGAAEGRLGH